MKTPMITAEETAAAPARVRPASGRTAKWGGRQRILPLPPVPPPPPVPPEPDLSTLEGIRTRRAELVAKYCRGKKVEA